MNSRIIITFFFVAVFVMITQAEEQPEERIPAAALVRAGVKILGRAFAKATASCLEEAAAHCKDQLKHPKELVKCGGAYLRDNKGRCLL